MKISIGTQHLLRQFELERQQIKIKRSIRLLLDSVEDVNDCQVLHLAYLWHFRLIYLILGSCMPSQHKPPSAACSALTPALGRCESMHQHVLNGKNTQMLSPTGHSRKMAACKTLNCYCTCAEICSAQHEKTGRLRIKTANADRNPTFHST